MTMGSLFSGAGTCEYAAELCGITPVWSSEIEPFPVAVTAKRFPHVKQLGDITQINGAEIEPVDIITFGSPCQDLSVAGQGKGFVMECPECGLDMPMDAEVCPICGTELESTRSGLFLEAIRIFKEMREATNGKYPRFIMWENVLGAFSSQKGEDFRTVLEEICKIKDPECVIPRSKKWANAGSILAEGYSLAWRVLDAQYWGVPQRRRRIFLVADFGGQRAGEICFERESLRGYSPQGGATGERTAGDFAAGFGTTIPINTQVATRHEALGRGTGFGVGEYGDPAYTLQAAHSHAVLTHVYPDIAGSLLARADSSPCLDRGQPFVVAGFNGHKSVTGNICYGDERAPSLECKMPPNVLCYGIDSDRNTLLDCIGPLMAAAGTSGSNHPVVFACRTDQTGANGLGVCEGVCHTLDGSNGQAVVYDARGNGDGHTAPTITGDHNNRVTDYTAVAIGIDRAAYNQGENAQYAPQFDVDLSSTVVAKGPPAVCAINCRNATVEDIVPTLQAKGGGGHSLNCTHPIIENYIARRLTPTECARLQGMPDWWTADVPHKDAPEYKMWGNGMALPNVLYIMEGLADELAMRILDEKLGAIV